MTCAEVLSRAWSDTDFRTKLLSNPRAALIEADAEVLAGKSEEGTENTADRDPVSMAAPWTGTGDPYKLAKTFHTLGGGGAASSERESRTKKGR